MNNILIVGLGNIGSRHLQSMTGLYESTNIYLLDPNEENLSKAEKLFESTSEKLNIDFSKPYINLFRISTLEELPNSLNFVIVSTSSRIRADLVIELLSIPKLHIDCILLEKFLFSRKEDYQRIQDKLAGREISAYCNEWISSNYTFSKVKNWLSENSNNSKIEMTVTGNRWGLASNIVHFIAYFHELAGCNNLFCASSEITRHTESKRNGYLELFGRVCVESDDHDRLMVECSDSERNPGDILVQISNKVNSAEILLESNNLMKIKLKDGENFLEETHYRPYQSQLTSTVINTYFCSKEIYLPGLSKAMHHHAIAFDAFWEYCEGHELLNGVHLPIT